MSDIMDDWFGIDPAPEPPVAQNPARPAPTKRQNTNNVLTGVDNTRRFSSSNIGGSSISNRTLFTDDAEFTGVGLNV